MPNYALCVRRGRLTVREKGKTLENSRDFQYFLRIFIDFFEIMLIIVIRMDMQKSVFGAKSTVPADFSRQKIVVGAKQLRKALRAGTVRQVYLAENADPAVIEPLAALCQESNVNVSWVRSMAELGKACGIEVGAAAAAVVA